MYRPKETESRPPADEAAGLPHRGSLLDQISDDRRGITNEETTGPAYDKDWQRPARKTAADRPLENGRQPAKTFFQGSIDAQVKSLSEIGIADILIALRRGVRWIVLLTLLGMIGAFVYSITATPRFVVYTDIIIDPANLNVVSDDVFSSNPQRDSQLLEVESKLRVLTSRNVLTQVIKDLDLTNDPEFTKPGLLDPLMRMISPQPEGDRELAVLRELGERVGASREERSFVVVLSVWTSDPEKSVRLSDAIARAFETELFTASAESAGRIAASLNGRLDELRRGVTEAEERVEQFRRENSLQSSAGELSSSRISTALDTQVLDAQQRLIQAEARYNQMRSAVADRRAVSATVFDSPGMTALRTSYNTLQQQIGSLTRTLGDRHPRLISLQSERATIEKAVTDEANRILQATKTDADQARSALGELRLKADAERSTVFTNNDAQVRLRELERDARAKAAVYETFLARTHQITERQQIDTSNVRVISTAIPPKAKSWPPRTLILLAAGAIGGFMAGVGLALLIGLLRHLGNARHRHADPHGFA